MPQASDPWAWNAFDSMSPDPQAGTTLTPFQPRTRHTKPIPDQKILFSLQRQLQQLKQEIDEVSHRNRRSESSLDLGGLEAAYAKVWKTTNDYLREWAS